MKREFKEGFVEFKNAREFLEWIQSKDNFDIEEVACGIYYADQYNYKDIENSFKAYDNADPNYQLGEAEFRYDDIQNFAAEALDDPELDYRLSRGQFKEIVWELVDSPYGEKFREANDMDLDVYDKVENIVFGLTDKQLRELRAEQTQEQFKQDDNEMEM